jgi:hypothetical protein
VILSSALAWGVILVAVPPWEQNFPLIDDWAYARGAFAFAAGQGIDYCRWAAMPELGQWLWAWPFIQLFGPTHFVLRIATIILSWLGLAAFYDLLRQGSCNASVAALVTGTLAACPLFFVLQGTFMTDVPALSFSLLALALFGRASLTQSRGFLIAASMASILAVTTRQNTLALPLTVAWLLGRKRELRWNDPWVLATLIPLATGLGTLVWLKYYRPDSWVVTDPGPVQPHLVLLIPYLAVCFFGLIAAPLLLLKPLPNSWRAFAIALAAVAICAFYWHGLRPGIVYESLFPYWDGVLTRYGVDARSTLFGHPVEVIGPEARGVLTVLGCLGGALASVRLGERFLSRDLNLLVVFGLWQVPLLFASSSFYDRYLLFVIPSVLYLAAPRGAITAWGWAAGLCALFILAAASVTLTHDWFAWNSALWKLGERTVVERTATKKTDPWDIEGGFEWDGLHAPENPWDNRASAPVFQLPMSKGHFPHVRGKYALSFTIEPGTVAIDHQSYHRWLAPSWHEIYLLAPKPASPAARR